MVQAQDLHLSTLQTRRPVPSGLCLEVFVTLHCDLWCIHPESFVEPFRNQRISTACLWTAWHIAPKLLRPTFALVNAGIHGSYKVPKPFCKQ